MRKIGAILIVVFLFWGCKISKPQPEKLPSSKREMRAIWVASVLNLDFPSSQKLTTEEQKVEFVNLLDSMEKYHFNTIVMQIRPSGDALYNSPYEPWSEVLTGTQGKAPSPYYDPLEFMITESHKRNIDFHAWLNPYRAIFNHSTTKISKEHPINKNPQWFVKYGSHTYYNPALPEVRHFIAKIVGDITRRYDIDAIHMDDYFYPYRIAGKEFPDQSAFLKNKRDFTQVQKDDWRRDNVNLIIKELRDTIKQVKPWVQFGISPFGVWRNKDKDSMGSETRAGQTNYDDLYADILLWLKKGWVDYITPQIYWHIGHPVADYKVLVKWWNDHTQKAHLYIGMGAYKLGNDANYMEWNDGDELTRQLLLNSQLPKVEGAMFFRAKNFEDTKLNNFKRELRNTIYRYPAIPPETMGLLDENNYIPNIRLVALEKDKYKLEWYAPIGEDANALKYYVVYMFEGKRKIGDIDKPGAVFYVGRDTKLTFSRGKKKRHRTFVVTRVNKANQESDISKLVYIKL